MRDNAWVGGFHYSLWEDWANGLYAFKKRGVVIGDCATLLRAPDVFACVLNEVVQEWPVATAQHLSDPTTSHQSWCGRAACSYEFGATIHEVNQAWADLTHAEHAAANRVADAVTEAWRSLNLRGQLGWRI